MKTGTANLHSKVRTFLGSLKFQTLIISSWIRHTHWFNGRPWKKALLPKLSQYSAAVLSSIIMTVQVDITYSWNLPWMQKQSTSGQAGSRDGTHWMESPTFWLVLTRWAMINGSAPASSLSPRHLRVTLVSSRSDSNRPTYVMDEIPDRRSEEEGDKPA